MEADEYKQLYMIEPSNGVLIYDLNIIEESENKQVTKNCSNGCSFKKNLRMAQKALSRFTCHVSKKGKPRVHPSCGGVSSVQCKHRKRV